MSASVQGGRLEFDKLFREMRQVEALFRTVELEVDGVAQGAAVDREDPIARRQPGGRAHRPRAHRRHHDALSGRARFHPARGPRRRAWR